jgi:hypothetical protein
MPYLLSDDSAEILAEMVAAYRGGRLGGGAQTAPPPPARIDDYLAVTTDTITAASGDTLGSGPVLLRQAAESGTDWVLEDSEVEETAYNPAESAIPTGTQVQLIREPISGKLLVQDPAGTPTAGPRVSGHLLILSDGPVVGHPDPWLYSAVRYTPGSLTALGTRGEAVLTRGPNFENLVQCRKYGAWRYSQVGKAVAFELSGVADGTCPDCEVLDDLWVLDSTGFPPDPLGYTAYLGINLGILDGKNLCMTLSYAPAIPGWLLTIFITPATDGGAVAGYVILANYLDGAAGADWDTAGPLAALDMALYGTPPGDCTGWPEALTIRPTVSSTGAAKIYVWVTQETADGNLGSGGGASEHTAASCEETTDAACGGLPAVVPYRMRTNGLHATPIPDTFDAACDCDLDSVTMFFGEPDCHWVGTTDCLPVAGGTGSEHNLNLELKATAPNDLTLTISGPGGINIDAIYQGDTSGWDGASPLSLSLYTAAGLWCQDYPATIEVLPA